MDTNTLLVGALMGVAAWLAIDKLKGHARTDDKHEEAILGLRREVFAEIGTVRDDIKNLVAMVSGMKSTPAESPLKAISEALKFADLLRSTVRAELKGRRLAA